ncbi:MAG TPA: hypothetical protein VJP40_04310 [bacterium]|nr:hypothetical protein [bacterium]
MSHECRNNTNYAVSICPSGHATLYLARSAFFLEVEELKSLVEAAQEVLAKHEQRREEFSQPYSPHLAH